MATLDELQTALVNADAAGDTSAATFLANAIKAQQAAPANNVGPVQAGFIGAGRSLDRLAAGLRQKVQGIAPPVANALDAVDRFMGNQPPSTDAATQQAASDVYKPLEKARPVATFTGEVAPTLAAVNPLTMAGLGALEYGTPAESAMRAGAGYLGGKVGQGVARLFGPKSMAPAADTLASEFFPDAANKWGIPTTVGMNGNKTAKLAESVIANMPFVNGPVNSARDAAYGGFNKAVSNTFGENTSALTPELFGQVLDRSGKQIGDIMQQAQAKLSPEQAKAVAELSGTIADLGQEGSVLNTKLGKVIDGMTNGQALSGQTLRMLDSSLGRIMGSTQNGDLRYAAGSLQNIIRDAATESLPKAQAQALKLAREQNFNVRQVADASRTGTLSPSQLLTQVNNYQRKARYGGGNNLAELAQWAKPVLTDQIPNSGTAQRALMQRILTNPATGALELAGLGYGASQTDNPYAIGGLGLIAPYLTGRALAGKPASDLTRSMLMRGGGLLGLQLAP